MSEFKCPLKIQGCLDFCDGLCVVYLEKNMSNKLSIIENLEQPGLRSETDRYSDRMEAADVIRELYSALEQICVWKDALDVVAPELGAFSTALYSGRILLEKLEKEYNISENNI